MPRRWANLVDALQQDGGVDMRLRLVLQLPSRLIWVSMSCAGGALSERPWPRAVTSQIKPWPRSASDPFRAGARRLDRKRSTKRSGHRCNFPASRNDATESLAAEEPQHPCGAATHHPGFRGRR